jgi:glycosyltransferase involved in cell wall biosynthesis
MRVCFVDRIGAHAIWGIVAPIANRLIAEGHQVDYVRMDDGGDRGKSYIPDGVKLHDLSVPAKVGPLGVIRQQWLFLREFRKILQKLKPDIVHTNFAVPSIVARWAAAKEEVPVIVSTQHELYGSMHFYYRWGLRLTERYCTAITYVSNTVSDSFGHTVAIDASNQTGKRPLHRVIPNGVDINKIRTVIANTGERVPGRIVCAGRMVPVKGQQLLIEALPEVVRKHPHIRLHLIGSGPMEGALRRRVDELGLAGNVDFLGWQPHDNVLRQMALAELIVVPSSVEGFGLVVAEALVCGTPLLVSDIPVFREVLDGIRERARLFNPGDVESLVHALADYPFTDSGDVPSIPMASLDELEKLSASAMSDTYINLYKELTFGSNG